MGWQPRIVFLFIGLPILGACAATLYYFHKKEDSDWEEFSTFTNRTNVIEVQVPLEHIGNVIGRGGANIKEIQERTNTKINFKEAGADAEFRICRIRGSADAAQMAECLIREAITNQPFIETVEMWVPQKACGRIIGKCGDNIRAISKQSNAQITVDRSLIGHKDKKQVLIKGTAEQIAVAKSLIEEKIEEDDVARAKMQSALANRSPRNKANQKNKKPEEERKYERLIATNSDNNMIQVYVSSVANPAHFWLQLISPRAVELDQLVEEMTEFYNKEENRELHKVEEVAKGQILAARYENDDKWYRVEACGVEDGEGGKKVVDVFYVDYGDSAFLDLVEMCRLRTDFLQLRFQAVECTMAGIKPKGGEDWPEESITAFEDLCYTAQWKPMTAQIVGYKERQRSHREGSPIPCVKLYDPAGKGLDIAKELVDKGFAETAPEEDPFGRAATQEPADPTNASQHITNGKH